LSRVAIGIEYDGRGFVGWQSQANGRSVQDVLTAAVSTVADEPVQLAAAGRTDAGVHAEAQVAHFDSHAKRAPRQWVLGINANLPNDVAVTWAAEVADEFDARRSALARCYRYVLLYSATRPVLSRRSALWVRSELNLGAMSAAASQLLGERDFSALRAAGCQSNTPMRCVTSIRIRAALPFIYVDVTANAFLYHMVRNMVGSLLTVGMGARQPAWLAEVLASRDRRRASPTAPAHALTLRSVSYPPRFNIPAGGRPPPLVRRAVQPPGRGT
jgi:tRNA pseudouridine38-40 synthase